MSMTHTSADGNVEIEVRPVGSEPAEVTAQRHGERDALAHLMRANGAKVNPLADVI
jgi:hypothetical protein